jgi:hypothetical protein
VKLDLSAKEAAGILRRRNARANKRAIGKRVTHENAKPDRGRVRDKVYLAHVRRKPCTVGPDGCEGAVEAAHLRFSDFAAGRINPGKSRKSDDCWALPLCQKHHREQHATSERRWWEGKGIDPNAAAMELRAAFDAIFPDRTAPEVASEVCAHMAGSGRPNS